MLGRARHPGARHTVDVPLPAGWGMNSPSDALPHLLEQLLSFLLVNRQGLPLPLAQLRQEVER